MTVITYSTQTEAFGHQNTSCMCSFILFFRFFPSFLCPFLPFTPFFFSPKASLCLLLFCSSLLSPSHPPRTSSRRAFPLLLISAVADAWVMRISVVLNMKWWGGPRRGGINKSHYLSSLMMQPPPHPHPRLPTPPLLLLFSLHTHHPLSQPISTRYPILDGRRLWIIESQGQCALPPITQWKMTPSWLKVCVFARRCVGMRWVECLTRSGWCHTVVDSYTSCVCLGVCVHPHTVYIHKHTHTQLYTVTDERHFFFAFFSFGFFFWSQCWCNKWSVSFRGLQHFSRPLLGAKEKLFLLLVMSFALHHSLNRQNTSKRNNASSHFQQHIICKCCVFYNKGICSFILVLLVVGLVQITSNSRYFKDFHSIQLLQKKKTKQNGK